MATTHRIFISFAVEDMRYRDFLVGQARNDKSPFGFMDMSAKEAWDNAWKTNCRTKIKGCDGMITLVSQNTAKAEGQLWEISCAKEERIPILGIYIDSENKPVFLPQQLNGVRVLNWAWPNIKAFLDRL